MTASATTPGTAKGSIPKPAAAAFAVIALIAFYELYKLIGGALDGSVWLPVSPDDLTMPHFADIIGEFFRPIQRDGGDLMFVFLLKSAWLTFREATVGFAIGTLIGLGLAILMLRFKIAERGVLPWINISQTVPLIALAPIIVTWGRSQGLGDFFSVSLIAAYLTFFPIAINGLKGLQSPNPADIELMRSYASDWKQTLIKVRLPSAQPFLFPAFKLAATLSVVGAIVGEISTGVRGGLGRVILRFAGEYTNGPEKVYAAVLAAALLGLFVFSLINLAERYFVRGPQEHSA